MAQQDNTRPLIVGDKVRLNAESNWYQSENKRRAREGDVGEVVYLWRDQYDVKFADGTQLNGISRSTLILHEEKGTNMREKYLNQIRAERRAIEADLTRATEGVRHNQKIVEESVTKMEQIDGIISDLS